VIFVGVDWAEAHHDVCVLDEGGEVTGRARVSDGVAGVARLHALIGEHADEASEVVVGIETDRGLLVGALLAAGYRVFAINPLAVSRYRDRHACPAPSPTRPMPRCWPIWSAPTDTTTGRWPGTRTWSRGSR
jgi:Transposase